MRRRPLAHATFTLGAAITLALVAVAGLSLLYTPADPLTMSITGRLQGPSGGHPFGTDQFGRDILSRVMAGAVTSIAVGVIAVGIGAGLGVLLGLLSGYVGGWLDETLMRLVDAVQGFPAILSALLFTAVFAPGTGVSMVAIGIAFVPVFARLTRGCCCATFCPIRWPRWSCRRPPASPWRSWPRPRWLIWGSARSHRIRRGA